jgi:hypothetical protein
LRTALPLAAEQGLLPAATEGYAETQPSGCPAKGGGVTSTRPRRPHAGRRAAHLSVTIAVLIAMAVTAAGCEATPSKSSPSAAPTPASSGTPTVDRAPYMRAEPGAKLDIPIRKNYGGARWTGPWDLDLARLTLINGHDWLVVKLAFTRLTLHRYESSMDAAGDRFWVYLDDNRDRQYERELFFAWGWRGELYTYLEDEVPHGCRFDPQLNRATRTITLRIPRNCFPHLEQMRSRAHFVSIRRQGAVDWEAIDRTGWTDVASPGETVTSTDPAT